MKHLRIRRKVGTKKKMKVGEEWKGERKIEMEKVRKCRKKTKSRRGRK